MIPQDRTQYKELTKELRERYRRGEMTYERFYKMARVYALNNGWAWRKERSKGK